MTYNFVSQLFTTPAIMPQVHTTAPCSTRPNPDTTNATDAIYNG